MNKEALALIKHAQQQGWTYNPNGNHAKLVAPNGRKVPFSLHAKGKLVKTIAHMRKHGYVPAGR